MMPAIKQRLEADAPPQPEELSGPFGNACRGGQLAVAQYLLAYGADLNWPAPWSGQPPGHRGTGETERYRRLAARKGRDPRFARNIDSVDEERRKTDLIEESRHDRVSSLVKSDAAARRHDLAAVHAAHVRGE
jgi:hypothetical protein